MLNINSYDLKIPRYSVVCHVFTGIPEKNIKNYLHDSLQHFLNQGDVFSFLLVSYSLLTVHPVVFDFGQPDQPEVFQ